MGNYRVSDHLSISLRILTDGMPKGDSVVNSIASSIKDSIEFIERTWRDTPEELADDAYNIASDDQELIEHLLGVSFVMCQVGIEHVVSAYQSVQQGWVEHQESKHKKNPSTDLLGLAIGSKHLKQELTEKGNPKLTNKYSKITTINAFGNYFKHNDEWNSDWINLPDDSMNFTQKVIKASVGIKSVEFCKEGFSYLSKNQPFDQVVMLWGMVSDWSESIKNKYIQDLKKCGCRK